MGKDGKYVQVAPYGGSMPAAEDLAKMKRAKPYTAEDFERYEAVARIIDWLPTRGTPVN